MNDSIRCDELEMTMGVWRLWRQPLRRRRTARAQVIETMSVWICDVNGVLVDSTATVRAAFAATSARFGFVCDDRAYQRVKGLWLPEAYRALDPGGDSTTRCQYHVQFIRERAAELRAFPGVAETLAAARSSGMRLAAVTSSGEIAERFLVNAGLYSLLDCLVTQEEVTRAKPDPESIQRVLHLLGADPRDPDLDAFHVGDTAVDIAAGRAAGIHTVGVTYGVSAEAEIRAAEPDYVIQSFCELSSWLVTPLGEPLPVDRHVIRSVLER